MSTVIPMADAKALPELRMDAYYYGFDETGVRCVDEILSAVAIAGKGYHHTEEWASAGYIDQIQAAAGRAAALMNAAPELLEALKELLASELTLMPPYEAGKDAQDAWADRRAKARNDAAFIIAKAEGRS